MLSEPIRADLSEKMVFIGGPRQVGKTTLSRMLGATFDAPAHFNWDNRDHRQIILKNRWSPDADLLVFDEVLYYQVCRTGGIDYADRASGIRTLSADRFLTAFV